MSVRQQDIQQTVSQFAGKTIKSIDASAANMWTIYFTDGTFFSIETEYFGHGLYGLVPLLNVMVNGPQVTTVG